MKSSSPLPSVSPSSLSTQSSQLTFLNPHIIELSDKGFINSHIDSIKFSGNLIAGLSIGSSRVMTLKYDESNYNSTVTSNSIVTTHEENVYHMGSKHVNDVGRSNSNSSSTSVSSSIIMNDDLKISSILNKMSNDDDKVKDMTMIHSSLNKLIDHDYIINDHGLLFTSSCCSNDNNSNSNKSNNDNINHHQQQQQQQHHPSMEEQGQKSYSSLSTIRRPKQVDLTLLPRSLYILTGCWRYHYSHAILPSLAKRTSIIFRDVKLS